MTTYDLDLLTLINVGEDSDSRESLAPLFLSAYNEAYSLLCNSVLKPEATEAVQLDGSRRFDPSALQWAVAPGGILAVKSGLDYGPNGAGPAHVHSHYLSGDGWVAVPGGEAGGTVMVTYRCAPQALEGGAGPGAGSVPELMPEEFHGALASYAAAAFFRVRRKFERMQVWMDAWLEAVQAMRQRQPHGGLRLKDAYRPMP